MHDYKNSFININIIILWRFSSRSLSEKSRPKSKTISNSDAKNQNLYTDSIRSYIATISRSIERGERKKKKFRYHISNLNLN